MVRLLKHFKFHSAQNAPKIAAVVMISFALWYPSMLSLPMLVWSCVTLVAPLMWFATSRFYLVSYVAALILVQFGFNCDGGWRNVEDWGLVQFPYPILSFGLQYLLFCLFAYFCHVWPHSPTTSSVHRADASPRSSLPPSTAARYPSDLTPEHFSSNSLPVSRPQREEQQQNAPQPRKPHFSPRDIKDDTDSTAESTLDGNNLWWWWSLSMWSKVVNSALDYAYLISLIVLFVRVLDSWGADDCWHVGLRIAAGECA